MAQALTPARALNPAGLEHIKRWEGLRLKAYLCAGGAWTVGYGHTSEAGPPAVFPGMSISGAEAGALLERDLRAYCAAVSEAVQKPLSDNQFAALVSLCYNIGVKAFAKSRIPALINGGDYDAVNKRGNARFGKSFLRGDGQWAEPLPAAPALPAGMIAAFAMQKAPEGWLVCDGGSVSMLLYEALYAAIGLTYGLGKNIASFRLPDLRGEFIRGFDGGRGADSGRDFGSAQTDALQNVTGGFSAAGAVLPNTDIFAEASGVFALGEKHLRQRPMGRVADAPAASPDVLFDLSRAARAAAETRPRNVALLYCIKF